MLTYAIVATILSVGGWAAFGVYFWKNQGHKRFMVWANRNVDSFQNIVDRWQGNPSLR